MPFDFSQPPPQAKTLEEAQELINALWAVAGFQAKQIEEQARQIAELTGKVIELTEKVRALEEKLNTNSTNSSKPPSADINKNKTTKKSSGKKAGGQPGRIGKAREWIPEAEVDNIVVCYPEKECACGGVVIVAEDTYTPHQTIELPPIQFIVNEYRRYHGKCAGCGLRHEGQLPNGVGYGFLSASVLALVATLTGGYRLSKRLVQSLLIDLFGRELSVGMISESEEIVSSALQPVTQAAHDYVKQADIVHSDETGHKEKGKKQWMWIAIAGLVSVFLARASRSTEVAKELLGACFTGRLISDRYSAYTWIEASRRQLCWAHLLRDFRKIAERKGISSHIGEQLYSGTKQMFDYWRRFKDGGLSREELQEKMKPIQAAIEAALVLGAACADGMPKKNESARTGEAKTAATCKRLLALKEALWTFVCVPFVEPTNNLAEQMIRHYVIWRKICFGSQSKRGSLYMERVMTTVGSCKLQGRNVLDFITAAVSAHLGGGECPTLIPASTENPALSI